MLYYVVLETPTLTLGCAEESGSLSGWVDQGGAGRLAMCFTNNTSQGANADPGTWAFNFPTYKSETP